MSRTVLLVVASLSLASAACGLHPRPAAPAPEAIGHERVLLPAEIAAHDVRTAYEALARLRPEFLRWTRGAEATMTPVGIYVDGMRAALEYLQHIPAASVREVRLLRPSEATFKYGEGNEVAVIDVRTGAPE